MPKPMPLTLSGSPAARAVLLVALPVVLPVVLMATLAGCAAAPAASPARSMPVAATRVAVPVAPPATAQAPLYFHPLQAQDEARQERDRYDCYRQTVQATGQDPGLVPVRQAATPMVVSPAPVTVVPLRRAPPRADGDEVVAGAVLGAIGGAVLAPPRQGGSAVVLGALFGATLGALHQAQVPAGSLAYPPTAQDRAHATEDAQQAATLAREQALERQERQAQAALAEFRRGMSACMAGRGYRVE